MTIDYSLKDLPNAAKKIARRIKPGDILALSGELAAGKTTFTSALLKELGYNGSVASPTFVIERRYPIGQKTKIQEVIHLDFYRLSSDQIGGLDWLESIGQPKTLTVIEWPERIARLLPPQTKTIKLEWLNDQTRHLTYTENPPR
jgi:tRNA threonylcarbamoyladenosine biosynthesis protein TsaE